MNVIYNTLLFFPCFVSAFWGITLLTTWKKNLRAQNVWGLCMLTVAISSLVWGILFNDIEDYALFYKLDVVDLIFTLMFLPFVYYFFRSLTNPERFTWKQYIWLAPSLILGAISTVLYIRMGEEQSIQYIRIMVEDSIYAYLEPGTLPWWHRMLSSYAFVLILFLQLTAVLIYSSINFRRYRKGLTHFFSNLDETSIENGRAVLIALYLLLGMGLGVEFLWGWFFEQYISIRHMLMITFGLLLYYMSYHVSRLRFAAESILPENEEAQTLKAAPNTDSEPTNSATNPNGPDKFLPELIRLIDEEQIFLQPNLSVSDLSHLLNTNRTYTSQMINAEFECSFYEFINERRIRFALKLTQENPTLLQEQISQASGFAHVATFSRVFKRQVGMTFREWQKTLR